MGGELFLYPHGLAPSGLYAGSLLGGAVDLARKQGARCVDACPIDTERKLVWGERYVGLAPVFTAAGFEEVARRSPTRLPMRLMLAAQGPHPRVIRPRCTSLRIA